MRKSGFLCVLLLAAFLLCSCGAARFEATKTGYTDTKSGRHYTALASCFEAAGGGEVFSAVLKKYYHGERDQATLEKLG